MGLEVVMFMVLLALIALNYGFTTVNWFDRHNEKCKENDVVQILQTTILLSLTLFGVITFLAIYRSFSYGMLLLFAVFVLGLNIAVLVEATKCDYENLGFFYINVLVSILMLCVAGYLTAIPYSDRVVATKNKLKMMGKKTTAKLGTLRKEYMTRKRKIMRDNTLTGIIEPVREDEEFYQDAIEPEAEEFYQDAIEPEAEEFYQDAIGPEARAFDSQSVDEFYDAEDELPPGMIENPFGGVYEGRSVNPIEETRGVNPFDVDGNMARYYNWR